MGTRVQKIGTPVDEQGAADEDSSLNALKTKEHRPNQRSDGVSFSFKVNLRFLNYNART